MRANRCLLIATFVSILISCQPSVKSNESSNQSRIDTLVNSKDVKLYAIFKDSINFAFEYSNGPQKGTTGDLKMPPVGLPKVLWFDTSWIYLRGGCGSPCFYAFLIPLNGIDTLRTFMFPSFVDQEKRLLIYCDENDVLTIENFQKGTSVAFSDENLVGPYCSKNIKSYNLEGPKMVFDIKDLNGKTVKRSVDISQLLK
ncbi:hypothetical protein [Chitinophaga caseinilytica]|uniref:hypothetical protein n=1 Tax=Chitinophaga caseinilytica TaxID=2267521 RepID=UPI003C2BB5A6